MLCDNLLAFVRTTTKHNQIMTHNKKLEAVQVCIWHLNLSLCSFCLSNLTDALRSQSKHCILIIFLQVLRKFCHHMHCLFSDLSFGVLGISKLGFLLSVLMADYFYKIYLFGFMLLLIKKRWVLIAGYSRKIRYYFVVGRGASSHHWLPSLFM